jgi:hypothetical protein
MDNAKTLKKKKRKRPHAVDGRIFFCLEPKQRLAIDMICESENISIQCCGRAMVAGLIEHYLRTGRLPFDITPFRKKAGRRRTFTEILREIENAD